AGQGTIRRIDAGTLVVGSRLVQGAVQRSAVLADRPVQPAVPLAPVVVRDTGDGDIVEQAIVVLDRNRHALPRPVAGGGAAVLLPDRAESDANIRTQLAEGRARARLRRLHARA